MIIRLAYLLIGLCLGVSVASDTAITLVSIVSRNYDKDFLAATLTGYAEGWGRGRVHTEGYMNRQLSHCYGEVKALKQRIK